MPAPNTTAVAPSQTLARYIAAPRPVESPQAKSAAVARGASFETFAREYSETTVASAKVEQPMKWRIGSPSRDNRAVPSGR